MMRTFWRAVAFACVVTLLAVPFAGAQVAPVVRRDVTVNESVDRSTPSCVSADLKKCDLVAPSAGAHAEVFLHSDPTDLRGEDWTLLVFHTQLSAGTEAGGVQSDDVSFTLNPPVPPMPGPPCGASCILDYVKELEAWVLDMADYGGEVVCDLVTRACGVSFPAPIRLPECLTCMDPETRPRG